MFCLNFCYFFFVFSDEIKLYMKSVRQVAVSQETSFLRIQLYIPVTL